MSIEDINYLKENSIKQSYTFLVDSKSRDKKMYPEPSEYVVEFTVPFRHVVGIEVVDVSVPKTMYNVDYNNNKLYFYIAENEDDNQVRILQDNYGNDIYDKSMFSYIEIPPGDYTTNTFLEQVRLQLVRNSINLDIAGVDTPPELTNMIYFRSSRPFIIDAHQSTISEILGFDLYTNTTLSLSKNGRKQYKYMSYNEKEGFEKLYHSDQNTPGFHTIYAPGMMYLLGHKYLILKCPEIEQHLYRSLSYSKHNMGLAKIRLNSYGYNDEKITFFKVPIREFHPIGKLSKMTLRFETDTGILYDFKGVNHNIVFALYYYEPKNINTVIKSRLNPDYDPNFINYLYTQDEQQVESEDDEEDENQFSRDNMQIYKKRELEYNENGISKRNDEIAYHRKLAADEHYMQDRKLKTYVSKTLHGWNTESDTSDASDASDASDES